MPGESLEEVTQMAEAGDAGAQYVLAACLVTGEALASGETCELDPAAAAKWYGRAADQGHIEAAYNLATMHLEGEFAGADRSQGMALLHRAAEHGLWDANWLLAPIYAEGLYGQMTDGKRAAYHAAAALEVTFGNAAEVLAGYLRRGDVFDMPALAEAFERVAARLKQARADAPPPDDAPASLVPSAEIETRRLLLRRPLLTDAEAIFAGYAADPDVVRYLTWRAHGSVAESEAFVRLCQAQWGGGDNRPYVIAARAEPGRAVGMIDWRRDGAHGVTFGSVLAPAQWGRGYAAEALTTLLDWSLAQPEIFRAWTFCDVDNVASARVMEKAGMEFEGIRRRFQVAPNLGPEPRDCRVYAKVR